MHYDENGNPQYDDWTQEAQDALASQFDLLDAQGQGVTVEKLRAFYPFMGWNDLQKGLDALVASGKLTEKKIVPNGGKVAIATYFVS